MFPFCFLVEHSIFTMQNFQKLVVYNKALLKNPLTIGLDAKCIVFGSRVGSDPFTTFMGLADWMGIVTT